MKKLVTAALLSVLAGLCAAPALGANKCVINGKVEYMDTVCPSEAKSSTVRTAPNSLDTSHSYGLHKQWVREEECDAAKLTFSFNQSDANRAQLQKHCGMSRKDTRRLEVASPCPRPTPGVKSSEVAHRKCMSEASKRATQSR